MTEALNTNVTCPSCGKDGILTRNTLIDINKNPELRDKIFSREIFNYTCKSCGEKILVAYNCMYYDEENKKIIYLNTDNNTSDENINKYKLNGFSLRVVRTINAFIEKIAMLEDGVDDRVIELYKLLFEEQFEEQRPYSELINVFYAGRNINDDKLHFYFITDDGDNCETTLSLETYRNLYEHFISTRFAADDFAEIDAEWAVDALKAGVLEIN